MKISELGVGIITKQNATKDAPIGSEYSNVKKLGLGSGKPKLHDKKATKNTTPNKLFNLGITEDDDVLYHATYEPFLNSILANGLGGAGSQQQWEDSKPGHVYLARDPDVAESHAEANEQVPDNYIDNIIVLAIDTSKLDMDKLVDDPNVLDDDSTLAYKGVIPSNAFTISEGKRVPRKKGQKAGSKKHSDLYTDENPKGTIQGLKFATVKDAEASVNKIKRSGKKHAHKIQAAIAMEQRAKAAGKKSAAAVYRRYINAMKKKTKKMNELRIEKPDTKDTLGVKRKDMPQVKSDDYAEFIAYLKKNGAKFTKETIPARDLKAMQKEFSDEGILKQMMKNIEQGPNRKAVIASSDDYILDGHHRWLVAMNTGDDLNVMRVNLPAYELYDLVNKFEKTYYKDIYERGSIGVPFASGLVMKLFPHRPLKIAKSTPGKLRYDEAVTQQDIDQLETFADKLFAKVGIDVEFTRHFMDRVNDVRNRKPITMAELTRLFKQEFKRYGKPIAQMGPGQEAVMKDLQTDINLPFALQYDKENNELDLIAKTVMRKKEFKTPNREFPVEGWSKKYKDSINCSNPKGFSQKAHCAGKKKKSESINEETGKEMFAYFQKMHHDPDNNTEMKQFILSHDWELRDFTPDMFPSEEEFFDYDDPFDRIIDIDYYYRADLSQPIIVGPQYSDGKYSVIDGNHRAAAAQGMGKTIKGYFPVRQVNEQDSLGSQINFPGFEKTKIKPKPKYTPVPKKDKSMLDKIKRFFTGENINEAYLLQLERGKDDLVLHVKDTKTGERMQVRGKPGYETSYDSNDKLHQLLDIIGKASNISELMNGAVVNVNPKHPDGPRSYSALDDLMTEAPTARDSMNLDADKLQQSIDYFYTTHAPKNFGAARTEGNFKGLKVVTFTKGGDTLMFLVNNDDQAVFYVMYSKFDNGVAIGNVRSNGTVKATEVYAYLVDKFGTLYSDDSQTPQGSKIWTSLAKFYPNLDVKDTGGRFVATKKTQVDEGVNDPHIFKAVFLAGGPGSGKSFVAKNILGGTGLKTMNSDDVYEILMKKQDLALDPETIASPQGQQIRDKAKMMTKRRSVNWIDGRLGLLIDGTGKDVAKYQKQAEFLKMLGYDVAMIFVNTSEEIAQQRNRQRARSLKPEMVRDMWNDVQQNLMKFQQIFGAGRFHIIDNSGGLEDLDRQKNFDKVYNETQRFLNTPPKNRKALAWIKQQKEQNDEKRSAQQPTTNQQPDGGTPATN